MATTLEEFKSRMTWLDTVETYETEFLCKGTAARECIIVTGPGGCGKTSYLLDMAARLTTGKPMPGGKALPIQSVLFISAEDNENILKKRLQAAGGDPKYLVHMVHIDLAEDLPHVEAIIDEFNVGMIVLDPAESAIGKYISNNPKCRDIVGKLKQVLQRAKNQCTAFLIAHTGKNGKGLGCTSLRAVARGEMFFVKDEEDKQLVEIKYEKHNYSGMVDPDYYIMLEKYVKLSNGNEELVNYISLEAGAARKLENDLAAQDDEEPEVRPMRAAARRTKPPTVAPTAATPEKPADVKTASAGFSDRQVIKLTELLSRVEERSIPVVQGEENGKSGFESRIRDGANGSTARIARSD